MGVLWEGMSGKGVLTDTKQGGVALTGGAAVGSVACAGRKGPPLMRCWAGQFPRRDENRQPLLIFGFHFTLLTSNMLLTLETRGTPPNDLTIHTITI